MDSNSNAYGASPLSEIWDAHSHWTSEKLSREERAQWFEEARRAGIAGTILGGVDPAEWDRQKALYQEHPEFFRMSWGIHPWTASRIEDEVELDRAFERLSMEMSIDVPGLVALGELGLDFQDRFSGSQRERQMRFFEKQLDWLLEQRSRVAFLGGASIRSFPLAGVFHIVHAHEEALAAIEARLVPGPGKSVQVWGIIHSFSGEPALAARYRRLGLIPSISWGVLGHGKGKAFDRLKRTVLELGLGDFVLETDAPDQPPASSEGSKPEKNHPLNLLTLARQIAEWRGKGETGEEILRASTNRVREIFGIE